MENAELPRTTTTVRTSHSDLHDWGEPVRLLTLAERSMLRLDVRTTELARELFWVIAGNDTEWITETVSEPSFNIPVRRLLGALQFQFGHRYPLDTLATMLRPLSPDPDDLLHTLGVGSFTGEDHQRHAAKLDKLRDLVTSDDEDIARLGDEASRSTSRYSRKPLLKHGGQLSAEAATSDVGWLADHATTLVGPRGRQVQVPVEQLEAAVVRIAQPSPAIHRCRMNGPR